jgi:hypothetical protein
MDNLQEAYLSVYQELDEDGYKSPYQAPPAHGRSFQGNPEKGETLGNPARLSPAMRATQKSDQLRASEPGSTREKKQTTRARQLQRNFQSARTVGEETDLFDYLLEYLVAEGYADTNDNAIAIMANMSEEWRDSIVDEAYVDYRRGKLPSGRTPQQAAKGRESALTARQERDNVVGTPVGSAAANRRRERERRLSNQSDTVSMMDRSTTFGSRLSGNMRRGEPNTGPHQYAIDKRRAIKRAKEADERTRGRL